jgi:hypothetical protein
MQTFSRTYPGIHEALEKYWTNEMWDITNAFDAVERYAPKRLEDCNHKWRKIKIYKLEGDFYYCLDKCHLVIHDVKKKSLDVREKRRKALR